MDKNIIKKHLSEKFLSEVTTPGISLNNKIKKDNAKINKTGVSKEAKDSLDYNESLKQDKDTSKMAQNKFNYESNEEETYHDEMEIMNGQEMIEYDREPSEIFREKALEAIEGSSRMGNNPEWANVVPKQQGFEGPEFGKNLVKKIKSSVKKRNEQTPTTKMYGNDWEVTKSQGAETRAIQESSMVEMAAAPKPISEKLANALRVNIEKHGPDVTAEKLIDAVSETKMVSHMPDSMEYGNGKNKISALLASGKLEQAVQSARALAKKIEKKAMKDMGMYENKTNNNNNPQIKESMKRLRFKNQFKGVGNALKLIPEAYKVDNKVFEMTDGNETYKIRWEGSLSEGKAIILTAADKTLVNEDINRMKQLFGYKSQETLGLVKGNARLDENKAFTDIWNKTKALMTESDDIESAKASEGNWEEETKSAPEAKKHIQGSVSKDKGTQAPKAKEGNVDKAVSQAPEAKAHISKGKTSVSDKPKEGNWDDVSGGEKMMEIDVPKPKEGHWEDINIPQASEAKKHVHLKESEEEEEKEEGYDIMKEEPMDVTEMMDKMMKEEEEMMKEEEEMMKEEEEENEEK
jgi:hypothetical protein